MKPKMKREAGVSFINRNARFIRVVGSRDALTDLNLPEFGRTITYDDMDEVGVTIDPRYDFNEVIDYIHNYGVDNG